MKNVFLAVKESTEKPISESTKMKCIECGASFKKKITQDTAEVKCPKCGGYDTEVDESKVNEDSDNYATIRLDVSEEEAMKKGQQIIDLLNLKVNKDGRVNTSWGDKTPTGLFLSMARTLAEARRAEKMLQSKGVNESKVNEKQSRDHLHNVLIGLPIFTEDDSPSLEGIASQLNINLNKDNDEPTQEEMAGIIANEVITRFKNDK